MHVRQGQGQIDSELGLNDETSPSAWLAILLSHDPIPSSWHLPIPSSFVINVRWNDLGCPGDAHK